ncbi:MAG: hypothetical protein U5K56_17100 [Halioglobus sp.]|nr:hypothetical protein [Halioglobus sp.]
MADDAEIHPDARLTNTVIGSGVRISHPVRMHNCVVFAKYSPVAPRDSYENVIIAGNKIVSCQEQTQSA